MNDTLGFFISFACEIFNNVCKVRIAQLYDDFVKIPGADSDWKNELKQFTQDYEISLCERLR